MTITGFISARIPSVCGLSFGDNITSCCYKLYVESVCFVGMYIHNIYIIYIYIYMRDLVTFDTGLVQVNLLLSQMRHIPSQ